MPFYSNRLSFIAEWFHEEASIIKPFIIHYYESDNSIEVFDKRTHKVFLKRTVMPDLTERDYFVGAKINIFGRHFDIIDYADEKTKNILGKYRKKTFVLLKTLIVPHFGAILTALIDSNICISNGAMVKFSPEQLKIFLKGKPEVKATVLLNELLTGPSIILEIIADNIIELIKSCVEQTKYSHGNIPDPLVNLFDHEEMRLGTYCSDSELTAEKDLNYFHESCNKILFPCTLTNSTLGIIKPHCIKEGKLGKIISEITNNGFRITAMRMQMMERINCEEFLEVYRGILPEYVSMVGQLSSGNSMAIEVVCNDPSKNTYDEFRKFCGPKDPEIAKLLRPHTLRANFGKTKVLNSIHCTDLPDDTVLELEYLFKVLN